MAFTLPIPATTVNTAPKTFTATVPAGLTYFRVSLDVAALDPATPIGQRATLHMEVSASYDGGATWHVIATKDQAGGTVPDDGGKTTTAAYMEVSIGGDPSRADRQVRGTVYTSAGSFRSQGGSITAS